jgi:predicted MFS family arabinose efflux permease
MMRTPRSGYRWFVIAVFFCFMLLHQSDKLLIGPLTPAIMDEFGISMTQMGAVTTGALVVASILYPIWGTCTTGFPARVCWRWHHSSGVRPPG